MGVGQQYVYLGRWYCKYEGGSCTIVASPPALSSFIPRSLLIQRHTTYKHSCTYLTARTMAHFLLVIAGATLTPSASARRQLAWNLANQSGKGMLTTTDKQVFIVGVCDDSIQAAVGVHIRWKDTVEAEFLPVPLVSSTISPSGRTPPDKLGRNPVHP